MTVTAVPPAPDNIRYVVEHLRARDREELFALRWDDDKAALARSIQGYAGDMSVCWCLDGVPVALQGAAPIRPGVWAIWCFGDQ